MKKQDDHMSKQLFIPKYGSLFLPTLDNKSNTLQHMSTAVRDIRNFTITESYGGISTIVN